MFRRDITLETGSKVRNIEGTSECSARGYDSWKEYYKGGKRGHKSRPWPTQCRIHGCTKKATDGAHVERKDESGVWIIPMCTEDNNPNNEDWMTVNAGTIAVQVEEEDARGFHGHSFSK